MSLIRINNLHTVLRSSGGDVHAVRGIDLKINRGETLCLVGESGSGKSVTALSLMRLLPAGIASHPQGEVLLEDSNGKSTDLLTLDNAAMSGVRGRRLSMIFQEPMSSLNPVFTIGDQITEALQISWPGMSATEAREIALQSLHEVQIKNPSLSFNEYPHRLSGGQKQRVMIAMALACQPDLLIADEPTTALDVTIQKEILSLIADLQRKKGMAVLFITHDLGVVAQIADRVAVMRHGEIVEQGRLDDVLYKPEHPYTISLLDALPENLQQLSPPEASKEVVLETRNLRVWFPVRRGLFRRIADHVKAVDDVSVKIHRGEIVALVGESGSGKSTLGRAMVRLLEPTAGEVYYYSKAGYSEDENSEAGFTGFGNKETQAIEIGGMSQSGLQRYRTDLQVVFQDPLSSLNPRLTIATTLTEPMKVHGIGDSNEHRIELAGKLLEDVQLPREYLWRYPHEFSGGQRQRIGIARALAVKPKLIVCDEVTSALDVSVQAELLQLLLQLRRMYSLTLLFITHNISVVEYVSDRTLVMYQGKLVETGDTAAVCGNPQHEYTRTLINAVPRLKGHQNFEAQSAQ